MIDKFENFYDNPFEIIDKALDLEYEGVEFKDVIYPGFSDEQDDEQVKKKLEQLYPDKEIYNISTAFRKGTDYHRLIHNDKEVADYNAVIYLSEGSRTAFWQHKFTSFIAHTEDEFATYIHAMEANEPSKWNIVGFTDGQFNSVSIFPSEFFHSIYPVKNKDNRLVQVVFFNMRDKEIENDN
jgi:hypothetical protein